MLAYRYREGVLNMLRRMKQTGNMAFNKAFIINERSHKWKWRVLCCSKNFTFIFIIFAPIAQYSNRLRLSLFEVLHSQYALSNSAAMLSFSLTSYRLCLRFIDFKTTDVRSEGNEQALLIEISLLFEIWWTENRQRKRFVEVFWKLNNSG